MSPFNRTIEELKYAIQDAELYWYSPFNRTIEELKWA